MWFLFLSHHHSRKWSELRNIESRCGIPVVAVSRALSCVSPRRVYREGCRHLSPVSMGPRGRCRLQETTRPIPKREARWRMVSRRCVFVRLHQPSAIVTCRLPIIARCVGDRFARRHRPSRVALHSCLLISRS